MARPVLTPKQELFVLHYIACGFNASEAARKAGYSEKTAYSIGEENLRKPVIKLRIEKLKKDIMNKVLCSAEWVVQRLMEEAESLEEDSSSSSRVAALRILTDYTGSFDANKKRTELTGKDGAPILLSKAEHLTDDQLASMLTKDNLGTS